MSYFIRIKNNEAFEHPIAEDNFKQAFPDIDIDNLPDEFARFVRVALPTLGPYEVLENSTYEWDGNIMKDVHQIRDMTEEEKATKLAEAYSDLPEGWTLNEETLQRAVIPPEKPDNSEGWIFDLYQNSWIKP